MDVFDLVAKISLDSSEYNKGLSDAGSKMSAFGEVFKANLASDIISKGFDTLVDGTKKAVSGLASLVNESQSAFGEYEQMVGGVQKLYGNMGKSLEQYASDAGKSTDEVKGEWQSLEDAQNLVLNNAKNAYKTAGMSANEYMENATQFSASLISSLGGDTQKAAEQTEVAMKAISDNVNTFGSNMEDVTNAFKGFSKQNYTMLDNLKLGYGGTKEEMERLIDDANTYAASIGQASDLSIKSFSDIVTAVELIQEKQNIAGTTAREATTTLQGSFGMMQAAWENLKTSIGSGEDLSDNIHNMVETIVGYTDEAGKHVNGYLDNLLPVISRSLDGIGELVKQAAPIIEKELPGIIEKLVPPIITAVGTLVKTVAKSLPGIFKAIKNTVTNSFGELIDFDEIVDTINDLLNSITEYLENNREKIVEMVKTLVSGLADAVTKLAPSFVEVALTIVSVLGDALISSIPTIIEKLPEFVEGLMNAIADAFKNASPAGKAAIGVALASVLGSGISEAGTLISGAGSKLSAISDMFSGLSKAKDGAKKGADVIKSTAASLEGTDKAVSKIPNPKDVAKGLADAAIIIGGTVGLVTAIGGFMQIPNIDKVMTDGLDAVKKTFTGIAEVAVPIGTAGAAIVAMGALVSPATAAKGLADMAIIIGGVEGVITAIGALMSVPGFSEFLATGMASTVAVFTGLHEIAVPLGEFTALIVALGFVSPAGVLSGLAGFALVIGGLEGVLAALGALSQIPGFDWIINEGGQELIKLGEILGGFAGSLVEGAISEVSNALPKVGENLAGFMEAATPFFTGLSGVNSDTLTAAKNLADAMLVLTAADVLNGLTSWFTGGSSFVDFGKQLADFGPYFKQYADSVKGINADTVTASSSAAKSLAEMAKSLPNEGGLVSLFTGDNGIDKWGEKLPEFGKKMKEYSDAVTGLDADAVTASANAAKSLSELSSNLPNSGGVAGFFAGNNDLDAWSEQLPDFGKHMKDYATNVAGINEGVVTSSANAAKSLSELSKNLPNSGGVAGFFAGNNDLGTWSEQLPTFGKNFKSYSDKVSNINIDAVNEGSAALKTLISAAEGIPKDGSTGIADKLSAYFDSMSDTLDTAASDLRKKLSDIASESMTNALAIGKAIVDGTWKGIKDNKDTFYSNVEDFFSGVVKSAKKKLGIHSPSTVMRDEVGRNLVLGLAKGIDISKKAAENAAVAMAEDTAKAAGETVEEKVKTFDDYVAEEAESLRESLYEDLETTLEHYETYHEMALADEVDYWDEARQLFEEGTEERYKADKKYFEKKKELDEEYEDAQKSLQERLAEAEKTFQDSIDKTTEKLKERKEEILSQFSLFEEFTGGEATTMDELTYNLSTQVNGLEVFNSGLDSLTDKLSVFEGTDLEGAADELLSTITEKGASANGELQALISAGTEQLTAYLDLMRQRDELAEEQAEKELLPELDEEKRDAYMQFFTDMEEAYEEYGDKMEELGTTSATQSEKVSTSASTMKTNVVARLGEMKSETDTQMNAIYEKVSGTLSGLASSASGWGSDLVSNFASGITSALPQLDSAISELAGKVKDVVGFSEPKEGPLSDFHTYAPDMVDLFASGIRDNAYKINDAIAENITLGEHDYSDAFGGSVSFGSSYGGADGSTLGVIVSLLQQYLPGIGNINIDGRTLVRRTAPAMNEELARINGRSMAFA